MTQPQPRVDRFLARLRDNKFSAAAIVAGLVVMAVANFTDALTNFSRLAPDLHHVNVVGNWQSEVLTDDLAKVEYTYVFDLKLAGKEVVGTALRAAPSCQESKAAICSGFGIRKSIMGGTLKHDQLSFLVNWGLVPGAIPWSYVPLKQSFRGQVTGDDIAFRVNDDKNSPPVEFKARRSEAVPR